MAKYRQLQTDFWSDGFVQHLNSKEKFFYLFLLTNMSTTQCGIYEMPKMYISYWTGYDAATVDKLIKSFQDYGKIQYYEETSEIFILNWIKYNLPNNCNAIKCVNKELKKVKNKAFITKLYSQCKVLELEISSIFHGLELLNVTDPNLQKPAEASNSHRFAAPSQTPASKEITNNKEKEINNKQGVINNNIPGGEEINVVDNVDNVDKQNAFKDVLNYFEDNIYKPKDWEHKRLYNFVQTVGSEIVKMAMDEAIANNAKKFRYIENILKRWIDKNLDTVEKVRNYNRVWRLSNTNGRQTAKGTFNNFEQRDYDFQELEKKLLGWDS